MIRKTTHIIPVLLAVIFSGQSVAAVSETEAQRLKGPELTPMGAEAAGNKDGTIPAYKGEGLSAPAGFGSDSSDPYKRPDPFANEKPLYTITAKNAAQYADKLDGMLEMFKRYPDFRMDIYPTHRTVTYNKTVIENTLKNATDCKGKNGDLQLEGCWGGLAFPIPANGAQAMWDHLTNYRGFAWGGYTNSYVVSANGSSYLVGGNKVAEQSPYYDPKATAPAMGKTIYWAFRDDTDAPSSRNGEKLVLIDPLDVLDVGRRAYQYFPGLRRVKLAPSLAYDTPSPAAGGAATMDDSSVFLGALDRYDWKLVGKKEKYIMYNNFKLTDHTSCDDKKLLTKDFANPDCVRWELHRVWVVEGKLKPGYRHIYARRMFYWDEDSFGAGLSENYDAAGKLYRVVTALSVPYYVSEGGGMLAEDTFNYDLQTGVWSAQGSLSNVGAGIVHQKPKSMDFFSPETMAGEGVR
ncbi:DUF1329 domain-containing protein [Paraburkholderia rhynchosiae]|uniref:DUF1329 domain-containing protein n=1 Tax=Paraburkholderia rhynchosiae TaxID=487049 RepID=A0A2N7W526_9BURK|nr:DUF1329 domain-containing protein [Paraburkholderia rhynchosiae]PMS24504.1 DUF1329 domain-containing protein [Paraburkholderia rhynchosiae]CAB3735944.1 hypothetical protein LMG27174_06254 [Paraburkholderia rhynchosiae]